MTFDALRQDGLPTYYSPNQTPVTADVLVYGFVFAFLVIAFCLFVILPGIRGRQRLFVLCRVTISLFIGASIMLSNYGQSWEVSSISNVTTAYRAGRSGEIHADVGIKIGLRAVNITLKGVPEYPEGDSAAAGERVNYNERFHFEGSQGRNGFGRYAGRINREFREAQYRGLPYPILWVAEYFVLDGEGIRWGRSYRLAGFYTAILVWLSFPLWLISNIILMSGVLFHGLFMLLLTGGCMLIANIMYASIRYESQLFIPFSADHILRFSYGWSFYLCLVGGLLAFISSIVGLIVLLFYPAETEEFFGTVEEVDDVEYYHRRRPRSAGEIKKAWVTTGNKVKHVQLNEDADVKAARVRRKRKLTLSDAAAIILQRPKPVVVWEE